MQIKTTMRYHLTLGKMAIIKRSTITNAEESVEKKEPSHTAGGNVNWWTTTRHYGHEYGGSTKSGVVIDPAILLLAIYLEKTVIRKDIHGWT